MRHTSLIRSMRTLHLYNTYIPTIKSYRPRLARLYQNLSTGEAVGGRQRQQASFIHPTEITLLSNRNSLVRASVSIQQTKKSYFHNFGGGMDFGIDYGGGDYSDGGDYVDGGDGEESGPAGSETDGHPEATTSEDGGTQNQGKPVENIAGKIEPGVGSKPEGGSTSGASKFYQPWWFSKRRWIQGPSKEEGRQGRGTEDANEHSPS